MAMVVALQGEDGVLVKRVVDIEGALPRLLPEVGGSILSVLGVIDRYGDTVFNRLQAPWLLSEWANIEAKAVNDYERELCSSIRELFELMRDGIHLYVRFVGD